MDSTSPATRIPLRVSSGNGAETPALAAGADSASAAQTNAAANGVRRPHAFVARSFPSRADIPGLPLRTAPGPASAARLMMFPMVGMGVRKDRRTGCVRRPRYSEPPWTGRQDVPTCRS